MMYVFNDEDNSAMCPELLDFFGRGRPAEQKSFAEMRAAQKGQDIFTRGNEDGANP